MFWDMVTIKINEKSKEAAALLEYLRSLSFVKVEEEPWNTTAKKSTPDWKRMEEIARKMNKAATKRMMEAHDLAE